MNVDYSKTLVNTFGFMNVPSVLATDEVTKLISKLGQVDGAGTRGVLGIPTVAELARARKILDLARPMRGPTHGPFAQSTSTNRPRRTTGASPGTKTSP